MPEPTVENVCDILVLAQLHDAPGLKVRAAAFIRQHTAQLMGTEGWRAVYKTPELVQFLIGGGSP
jgi:speckle-type POZ protein